MPIVTKWKSGSLVAGYVRSRKRGKWHILTDINGDPQNGYDGAVNCGFFVDSYLDRFNLDFDPKPNDLCAYCLSGRKHPYSVHEQHIMAVGI